MKPSHCAPDEFRRRYRGITCALGIAKHRGLALAGWVCAAVALGGCATGKIGSLPGTPGGQSSVAGVAGGGAGTGGAGAVGGASGAGAAAAVGPCTGLEGLTTRRVRRLAEREYAQVVGDLLGAAAQQTVLATWPAEPTVGGFDNQDSALFMSSSLTEIVSDMAATIAAAADPTTIAPCATTGGSAACLQTFINSFLTQAYGRPPSADEVTAATTLAGLGQDYPTSVRLIVEMALQSPSFIYVSELGSDTLTTAQTDPILLTPYEIASQISFLLSGSRPDATLLQAAQTSGFQNVSDIQAQVTRLLPTARGQAALSRFVNGWFDMGPMATVPKSATVYPEYTPALAAAMQQEFDTFVTTLISGGNGTLASFFTSTSNNPPAALAPVYGADLLASGQLDTTHRKGLLSLPAVLTYVSDDDSSGPIPRGLLIRRQLLCQVVPDPPAAIQAQIAASPVTAADTTTTTREKFEVHVTDPACSGCHNNFDPIGFGMEDMDGLGRYRTTENGLPVDSSGQLAGSDVDGTFNGVAQLSAMLAQSSDVATCMVNHFFAFGQAREPVATDQCAVSALSDGFVQGGERINSLVTTYATNRNFIYRSDDR